MLKVLLIVVQGKPEGKSIPLTGPVFRIGRGPDCHLRPNSEEISRNHAQITLTDTDAILVDLGSRNGTRINGKPITEPHKLRSGELLQVGPLTFAIAIQGATNAATPSAHRPASLDDVPQDQIEAWLVSDRGKPTPDRPSAVYDGDTLTIDAYKEGLGSKSSVNVPTTQAPAPEPAAAPTPAPEPAAAPTPAPEPAAAPTPAPEPAAAAAPPVASAPEPPKPPAPEPARPAPAPPRASSPPPEQVNVQDLFEKHLDSIEHLPEGAGDHEHSEAPEPSDESDDSSNSDDADSGAESSSPEDEFVDESNPFYNPKKAAEAAEAAPSKPAYKDSSDAASDILRKMLDRRRGSKA